MNQQEFFYICTMKEMISGGLRAACDILLLRKCLACGRILLRNEEYLCLRCLADMPRTFYWSRSHNPMADRFNERIQTNSEEGQSSDKGFTTFTSDTTGGVCHEHYAYAAALFFYRSEASTRPNIWAGLRLAGAFAVAPATCPSLRKLA